MSAKVLQVVNSAFFGLRRQITDVGQAAVLLGLGTLRALVLSSHAFEKFQPSPPIDGFDLDVLQRHCSQVARVGTRAASARPTARRRVRGGAAA